MSEFLTVVSARRVRERVKRNAGTATGCNLHGRSPVLLRCSRTGRPTMTHATVPPAERGIPGRRWVSVGKHAPIRDDVMSLQTGRSEVILLCLIIDLCLRWFLSETLLEKVTYNYVIQYCTILQSTVQ